MTVRRVRDHDHARVQTGTGELILFSEWDRTFKNPMTTQAAIDRLVHHSVILEFDVLSFRTEDAKARGAKTKKGAPETPRSEAGV